MNIYESNTYRRDLSWLHIDDEPRVQERQHVKDPQSFISVFVAYLTIPSNNKEHQPDKATVFSAWSYHKFTEMQSNLGRKKLDRANQGPNFLGGSFSIGDNLRLQSSLELKVNPSILKNDFTSRTNPSIFTSIEPVLLYRSIETSWIFPALKSTNHFLPQSTVSRRSDSSSEANSSCCHRSDPWSHLE